jgi:hypothetical protein
LVILESEAHVVKAGWRGERPFPKTQHCPNDPRTPHCAPGAFKRLGRPWPRARQRCQVRSLLGDLPAVAAGAKRAWQGGWAKAASAGMHATRAAVGRRGAASSQPPPRLARRPASRGSAPYARHLPPSPRPGPRPRTLRRPQAVGGVALRGGVVAPRRGVRVRAAAAAAVGHRRLQVAGAVDDDGQEVVARRQRHARVRRRGR